MRLKITAVSLAAALALSASPALAANSDDDARGKAAGPGQLCKSQSHKKTDGGKGKSPFAACVIGVKRVNAEVAATGSSDTAPGRLCKDQSRKKGAADSKSAFAACVTGAAKAKRQLPS